MNKTLSEAHIGLEPSEMRAWFIWCLGALYFFSHYIIRVFPNSNGIIFISEFSATQTQIGLLATCFYLPYLFMQMPAGALLDRFGCRMLLSFAVLCCAFSTYLLSTASSLNDVYLSRLVLGVVSGFGFVGAIKLAATWFTPVRLGLVIGLTQALGMLGAAVGNKGMTSFYENFGWRNTLLEYALLLIALSVMIAFFVRNGPYCHNHEKSSEKSFNLIENIKVVFTHKLTWINAFYAGFIFTPIEMLGEVWGGQFIQNVHHTTSYEASHITTFIFYGWLIGGPMAGQISSWIGRKPVMIASGFCGMVFTSLILYYPFSGTMGLTLTFFCLGLTNGGLVAAYTVASELHRKEATGLSAGFTNMLSVLIGAVLHPVIGLLIDNHWNGAESELGNPIYTAADFQVPFIIMPICSLLAFLLSFFMKETLVSRKK